jgi:hypothetical protein
LETAVTDAITKFNLNLQTHLKDVENRFSALTGKVGANIDQADKELHRQIAALDASAAKAKASAEASANVMKKWVSDSVSAVEGWKAKMDIGMLTARAERADTYAKAASDVAIAGVDAAEKAALDAQLAHADVRTAKASKPH